MNNLWLIALGGAVGAVSRFLCANAVYSVFGRSFPYGTLSVNILGSFLIGLGFVLLTEKMSFGQEIRHFLIIGLLGAFTTFSTFSLETLMLLQQGQTSKAMLNIILSVGLCLVAAWLGLSAGRNL